MIESGGAFVGPTQDHILALAERARRCRRSWSTTPATASTSPRRPAAWSTRHRPARPDDPARRRPAAGPHRQHGRRDRRRRAVVAPAGRRVGRDDARRVDPRQRGQRRRRREPDRCWTQPGFGADPNELSLLFVLWYVACSGDEQQRRHLRAQLRHRERRPGAPVRRRLAADPAPAGPEARRHRRAQRAGRPDRAAATATSSSTPAAAWSAPSGSSSPLRRRWCSTSTGSRSCPAQRLQLMRAPRHGPADEVRRGLPDAVLARGRAQRLRHQRHRRRARRLRQLPAGRRPGRAAGVRRRLDLAHVRRP